MTNLDAKGTIRSVIKRASSFQKIFPKIFCFSQIFLHYTLWSTLDALFSMYNIGKNCITYTKQQVARRLLSDVCKSDHSWNLCSTEKQPFLRGCSLFLAPRKFPLFQGLNNDLLRSAKNQFWVVFA